MIYSKITKHKKWLTAIRLVFLVIVITLFKQADKISSCFVHLLCFSYKAHKTRRVFSNFGRSPPFFVD